MNRISVSISVAVLTAVFGAGCHKKVAAVAPKAPDTAPRTAALHPAAGPVSRPRAITAPSAPARSRMPDARTRARIDELLGRIQDAYFDYDRHDIRPDAEQALRADARELGSILKDYPDFKLVVEGNCDERGSDEYNMALGDARAEKAKDYLASLEIPAAQMNVVSYGKDRPVCTEHNEACWQKNRRAHIAASDTVAKGGA